MLPHYMIHLTHAISVSLRCTIAITPGGAQQNFLCWLSEQQQIDFQYITLSRANVTNWEVAQPHFRGIDWCINLLILTSAFSAVISDLYCIRNDSVRLVENLHYA